MHQYHHSSMINIFFSFVQVKKAFIVHTASYLEILLINIFFSFVQVKKEFAQVIITMAQLLETGGKKVDVEFIVCTAPYF